jgi:hypothetical protein
MAETAALLADEVLPERPLRQWVLSLPMAWRFLLATGHTAAVTLIERDAEFGWLSGEPAQAGSLDELIGHCIIWRIAVGPRTGQKVHTLQSVAAQGEGEGRSGAAQAGGFSLYAGMAIKPGPRAKLERLCRYVSRVPLAVDRLALSASG